MRGTFNLERIKGIYTFAATIVGAGILALPVFLGKVGFLPGTIMIVLVGVCSMFSAFFIAETFLRVKEKLHLPGLCKKFLGKAGFYLIFFGILIYIYGALTGYLSAGGQVIYEISQGRIPMHLGILIYFFLGTMIIYFGLRAVKSASFILFFLMILLFFGISGLTFFHLDFNLLSRAQWSAMPMTFGILLFAFVGHTIIPSLGRAMRSDLVGLKKVSFFGVLLPLILYLIWFFVISAAVPYGTLGAESPDPLTTKTLIEAKVLGQPATIPLSHLIGGQILIISCLFVFFATFTSFLGFGLSLRDSYIDISKKIKQNLALILVVLPPLFLALWYPNSFLRALEIAGLYGGGLFVGILPPLMVLRSRQMTERVPEFVTPGGKITPIAIFLFFLFGLTYSTLTFFS